MILAFLLQQFETGNQWIRTRIDCHPCITSEPTKQTSIQAVSENIPFSTKPLLFFAKNQRFLKKNSIFTQSNSVRAVLEFF